MIRCDRFFDLETSRWDLYVLGGVVDAGTGHYQSFRDERDLFWDLLLTGGEVWSWNGGLFDLNWFCEMARRTSTPLTISTAGTRITRIQAGSLTMRDGMALCPMGLAKAAPIGGVTVVKDTGLPCHCGTDCGGYCSIEPDMSEALYRRLDEYLRLDCEAGLAIMEGIIAEAEASGYELTGTIGGSAWRTVKEQHGIESEEWTSAHFKLARSAYYGGRTEIFRPVAEAGHCYDINSAYPAALASIEIPHGHRVEADGATARRAFANGRDGVFVARVEVPQELFIPPLPSRLPRGRSAYPVGPLQGCWPSNELREAESLGCSIQIDGGLLWIESSPLLAGFMEHVWKRRELARAAGNAALVTWHKLFANSLTGKLAESAEKDRLLLHPDARKIRACPGGECGGWCRESRCCDHRCTKRCGVWSPIDPRGSLWTAPFWRISDCAHPQWAAFLTAHTRIELAAQLRDDGQGGRTAVYCDTDSVYATAPRTRHIGTALGEWGSDGPFRDFLAVAPKLYRYTAKSGELVCKAKGLSGITPADFERYIAGEPVLRDRGVMGLRSAARAGGSFFTRKRMERRSHADRIHYGSRLLSEDGTTQPQTITELMKWETRNASA